MVKFSKIAILGAALAVVAPFASAQSITGTFNFSGAPASDVSYTTAPVVLTFNTPAKGVIGVPISGTLGNIEANPAAPDGLQNVTFPTTINTAVLPLTAILSVTDNGVTVTFTATSDTVTFDSNNFADITFFGTITETGQSNTPGMLVFDTHSLGTAGTYSGALIANPTPEPSSLILLGTGLVGAAGMLVRRRRIV